MSIAKAIHPVVGLGPLSNADLEKTAGAIHTGVYFSGNFTAPPPPIDEATFKAQLDRFSASTIAAADGSRKAIAESKKERQLLLRMIRQLGHYVEANCRDDMATFLSSGFKPIQRKRSKQPVASPRVLGVANGSIPVWKKFFLWPHVRPVRFHGRDFKRRLLRWRGLRCQRHDNACDASDD